MRAGERLGDMPTELARFQARCTRLANGCLVNPHKRYGSFKFTDDVHSGQRVYAHRAAYTVHVGPIPDGYLVRHSCDEPRCIEPSHLSVGTTADNSRDMAERRRGNIGLKNPSATIPPADVEEAIRLYLGGMKAADVAALYGVTRHTVAKWGKRESRRDVDSVEFADVVRRPQWFQPCGTPAAYRRHLANSEETCQPCRDAIHAYHQTRKAS